MSQARTHDTLVLFEPHNEPYLDGSDGMGHHLTNFSKIIGFQSFYWRIWPLTADQWFPPSSTVIGISDRREIVSHSRPPVQTLISMHWKILLQPILNQDCTTLPPAFVNVPACWVIFSPNRNRNVFAKQRTISVSHWLCCEFSPHLRLKKMTQWQGEVVGTERPFYRQMKLNPITIRLCNSVDQSNIFSLNNLEIHYMNFMFLIKTGKIGNSQKKMWLPLWYAKVGL